MQSTLITVWHEICAGVWFRGLPIFCVSLEQIHREFGFQTLPQGTNFRGFLASFSLVLDVRRAAIDVILNKNDAAIVTSSFHLFFHSLHHFHSVSFFHGLR